MHSLFDNKQLEIFRKNHKIDPYRIKQIFLEVFKNSLLDFNEITTLSHSLRELFAENFVIQPLNIQKVVEGPDTTKFLSLTDDGKKVETVLMYHYADGAPELSEEVLATQRPTKKLKRITLCISSQVGCAVGCVFCVTGKLGFIKNLDMTQILGQILFANNHIKKVLGKKPDNTRRKVRNLVYMGMGEPFLNYDSVIATMPYVSEPNYLGLSNKRITISTSGITNSIDRFTLENPPASLAFSLHAPNQTLREKLVPFAKTFPLDELMQSLDNYTRKTGNEVFYEYVMIKDINDSDALAHETGKLLGHRKGQLNLIAYNKNPVMKFEEPSRNRMMKFKKIIESYGVIVTIRVNMGRKSKGACGQLGRDAVQKNMKITV